MHTHTEEELDLIRKLAKIEGLEVLGEVLCYRDPEDGTLDIKGYTAQGDNVFDTEWNFLYPVCVTRCICEDTELLAELEAEWDSEANRMMTMKEPKKYFGHSFYCLTSVPEYTSRDGYCLRIARELAKGWDNERKLAYVNTLMFGTHMDVMQFLVGCNDGQG